MELKDLGCLVTKNQTSKIQADKLYPPVKEVLIIHQTVVLHQLQYLLVGLHPGQLA